MAEDQTVGETEWTCKRLVDLVCHYATMWEELFSLPREEMAHRIAGRFGEDGLFIVQKLRAVESSIQGLMDLKPGVPMERRIPLLEALQKRADEFEAVWSEIKGSGIFDDLLAAGAEGKPAEAAADEEAAETADAVEDNPVDAGKTLVSLGMIALMARKDGVIQ